MTRTQELRTAALVALPLFAMLGLAGCTPAADGGADAQAPAAVEEEAPATPLDLVGEWTQTNRNSETTFQEATITADTITVNWINTEMQSTSLFWAGTYVAPTEATESYIWDSANDTTQTANSLLASDDPTKTFTYESGVLSYEVTMMGTTMTVELERE